MTYQEGTNGLPRPVEEALVEAKAWYDEHAPDIEGWSGDDIGRSALKGADLLMDIIEAVDRTWGFK